MTNLELKLSLPDQLAKEAPEAGLLSPGRMSEQAFARVWDNPEDSAYDAL